MQTDDKHPYFFHGPDEARGFITETTIQSCVVNKKKYIASNTFGSPCFAFTTYAKSVSIGNTTTIKKFSGMSRSAFEMVLYYTFLSVVHLKEEACYQEDQSKYLYMYKKQHHK